MCYTVYRRKQGNKWGSIMGIHIEVRKPDDGSVEDKIRKYKNKIHFEDSLYNYQSCTIGVEVVFLLS